MKGCEIMNRLKELRQDKKLSQKEIAFELQVPLRTYQRWENGESQIKQEKAQQLADYFEVSIGYLLGYDIQYPVVKAEVEELEEIVKEEVDNYFKDFLHYLYNEGFLIKDKDILLLFNSILSHDVNFGLNQLYTVSLEPSNEFNLLDKIENNDIEKIRLIRLKKYI